MFPLPLSVLNGKGRWARMLANVWLKRQGYPITEWPEEMIGLESRIRHESLTAIQACDEGDDDLSGQQVGESIA